MFTHCFEPNNAGTDHVRLVCMWPVVRVVAFVFLKNPGTYQVMALPCCFTGKVWDEDPTKV